MSHTHVAPLTAAKTSRIHTVLLSTEDIEDIISAINDALSFADHGYSYNQWRYGDDPIIPIRDKLEAIISEDGDQ